MQKMQMVIAFNLMLTFRIGYATDIENFDYEQNFANISSATLCDQNPLDDLKHLDAPREKEFCSDLFSIERFAPSSWIKTLRFVNPCYLIS